MTGSTLTIDLGGEPVLLDGDRAVVWDGHVFVADVHLDKAATFQRAGIAVPLGDEGDDLARLAVLAARHGATELVVLGDLVHAPPRPGGPTERALLAWQAAHPALRLSVVLGNHDRDAAQRLAHWPVRWWPEETALGPFRLRHAPDGRRDARPELAGHVHPVVRLRRRRDALRLPVFWQRPGGLVLPAFGAFTGGHRIDPGPEDRLVAVMGGQLLPLDGPRPAAASRS